MKYVGIMGKKGGIGKSTIAHLLCYGAVWKNTPGYMLHTDDRIPLEHRDRPYYYGDARDPERFRHIVATLESNNGICVIDGGGNRDEVDDFISGFVDLVLIPVVANTESIDLAIEAMDSLRAKGRNNARYVINCCSTNAKLLARNERVYYSRLEPSLVIGRLPEVKAVVRMTEPDIDGPFTTPPSNVNNLSRKLFKLVTDTLDSQSFLVQSAGAKKDSVTKQVLEEAG